MGKARLQNPTPVAVPFPVGGVDRSRPVAEQPPGTCPDALNVVGLPSLSDRGGGGKRDGTERAFAERLTATSGYQITGLIQFVPAVSGLSAGGGSPTYFRSGDFGIGLNTTGVGHCMLPYPENTDLTIFGAFTRAGGATNVVEGWTVCDLLGPTFSSSTGAAFSTDQDRPARSLLWDAGDGSGECLYQVGGAGTTPTINKCARWNGSSWTDMGTGITSSDPEVHAIAVYDGKLYIGGAFTTCGGATRNKIAVWDPANAIGTWDAVGGNNTSGNIYALEVMGDYLYAAGDGSDIGGVGVGSVARWNGTAWSAAGNAANGPVTGLDSTAYISVLKAADIGSGLRLYVGGNFVDWGDSGSTRIGNAADHALITSWDGTSWRPLQNGLRCNRGITTLAGVLSIEPYNDGVSVALWVAGDFNQASTATGVGIACPCVAKWDGFEWSTMDMGIAAGNGERVHHLRGAGTLSDQHLYATGFFLRKNQSAAGGLAVLDADSGKWIGLGGAAVRTPNTTYPSALCGAETLQNDLTEKLYVSISATMLDALQLYYGCGSTTATQGAQYSLAAWDGTQWNEIPNWTKTAAGDNPYAMLVANVAGVGNRLYVTGAFTGTPGVRIAAWDGTAWNTLTAAGLTSGAGYALAFKPDATDPTLTRLYVGGTFASANSVSGTVKLAQWDGTSWTALGTNGTAANRGVSTGTSVNALYWDATGAKLYIGGVFTQLDGSVSATNICYYEHGASFTAMQTLNGQVNAIVRFNGRIVAAGAFTGNGIITLNGIAEWNSDLSQWYPMERVVGSAFGLKTAAGSAGVGHALYVHTDADGVETLYVAGAFASASGVACNGIARWTGTAWERADDNEDPLCNQFSGFASQATASPSVRALGEFAGEVVAAGDFTGANGSTAASFARGDV